MIEKIKTFVEEHKKEFITVGVVAGSVVIAAGAYSYGRHVELEKLTNFYREHPGSGAVLEALRQKSDLIYTNDISSDIDTAIDQMKNEFVRVANGEKINISGVIAFADVEKDV